MVNVESLVPVKWDKGDGNVFAVHWTVKVQWGYDSDCGRKVKWRWRALKNLSEVNILSFLKKTDAFKSYYDVGFSDLEQITTLNYI